MERPITSCLTCRRRKVRCDRAMPTCSICTKGGHVCVYQSLPSTRNVPSSPLSTTTTARSRKTTDNTKRHERTQKKKGFALDHAEPLTPISWTNTAFPPPGTIEGDGQTNGILILDDQCSRFVSPLHWASIEKGGRIHSTSSIL